MTTAQDIIRQVESLMSDEGFPPAAPQAKKAADEKTDVQDIIRRIREFISQGYCLSSGQDQKRLSSV